MCHPDRMRYYALMLLSLVGCSAPKEHDQVFPFVTPNENEWVVYEGTILSDRGVIVNAELSLKQETIGMESSFELKKSATVDNENYNWSSKGKYSVSYGLSDNAQGLTVRDPIYKVDARLLGKDTSQERFLKRTIRSQEVLGAPELYFKTEGSERLIQTDKQFQEKDPRMVLYKRSDLFTVEGYISFQDSIPEFFERNTMKNWKVSVQGDIVAAKIKFVEVATELNEGIYLKALAYSIADTSSTDRKALVIKRVLRIEKSDRLHPIP